MEEKEKNKISESQGDMVMKNDPRFPPFQSWRKGFKSDIKHDDDYIGVSPVAFWMGCSIIIGILVGLFIMDLYLIFGR